MKKRFLVILTAIVFLCSLTLDLTAKGAEAGTDALTREDLYAMNGGTVDIHEENGKITFVGGTCTTGPVAGREDAERVVSSMLPLLGGDGRTCFEPWRELKDPAGNLYYVFRQVADGMLVPGGAVKVIADRDGNMIGLTASVVSGLPGGEDAGKVRAITAGEAEALVLRHEKEQGNSDPVLAEGQTRKIVLPADREPDMEAEELRFRYAWSVYTVNASAGANSPALPYLAHYVALDGEYLYSLPTIVPGDGAGTAGYNADYVFQFMEPAEYTGSVDLSDGTEKEITVTLMRDTRTGMYYLGNIEHRIVVADCWEFLYNHGHIVLEYSPDNREWDQTGLLALYNYCRAWDYYREIGWTGPDGEETPIMVLKDFCDMNRSPVDNASFAGLLYGWQTFLSSSANDLSQCLDVCAHEFTHCVTEAMMTYSAYENDAGAINEAISDIHGNLCEMLAEATEDTTWMLGENGQNPVRSMSDPNRFGQPGYVWDVYYRTQVSEPTEVNDRGGVHSNSSLLNHTAWLLCEDGGMTLEEARNFWFAAGCAMVPGTDYPQLRKLLPWVMKVTGMEAYRGSLARAMDATRMGESSLPETLEADKALLVLDLPDNEVFNNGNWILDVTCVNMDKLNEKIAEIRERADEIGEALLRTALEKLSGETETAERGSLDELVGGLTDNLDEMVYSDAGSAGSDGHTIRMMSRPGRVFPLLVYLALEPGSETTAVVKYLCQLNGKWFDLTPLVPGDEDGAEAGFDPEQLLANLLQSGLLEEAVRTLSGIRSVQDLLDALTLEVKGGQSYEISAAGLDKADLAGKVMNISGTEEPEAVSRKSRPRTE